MSSKDKQTENEIHVAAMTILAIADSPRYAQGLINPQEITVSQPAHILVEALWDHLHHIDLMSLQVFSEGLSSFAYWGELP